MKPKFNWQDPLLLEDLLTDEEGAVRDAARKYAQGTLQPRVRDAFREESYDKKLLREFGELGFLGVTLEGHGCPGGSHVMYGLIAREIERVDSGYRSSMSVQSSLTMYPLHSYATEELKQKWLPALAKGDKLGAFGLT